VRRDGDRIRGTTDSPHAWHLRVGGPDGILHTVEPGPGVTEIPCGD
jgi:alpha-D-xyloside xylohydrolase